MAKTNQSTQSMRQRNKRFSNPAQKRWRKNKKTVRSERSMEGGKFLDKIAAATQKDIIEHKFNFNFIVTKYVQAQTHYIKEYKEQRSIKFIEKQK